MSTQNSLNNLATAASETGQPQAAESLPPFQLTQPCVPPKCRQIEVARIKPHPAIQALQLVPTPMQLEALRNAEESIFEEPLTVTDENILIDGYKRLAIARERRIERVPCIVQGLSATDALKAMLRKTKSQSWIGKFDRILLTMSLIEPLNKIAKEHQQRGGREKHLAKLTKAEHVNMRTEIARLAGVSEGTARKVCVIAAQGIEPLRSACRSGSISIHAAFLIALQTGDEQRRALTRHETKRRERQRQNVLAHRTDPLHKNKADLASDIRSFIYRQNTAEQLQQIRVHFSQFSSVAETEAHDPSTTGPKAA